MHCLLTFDESYFVRGLFLTFFTSHILLCVSIILLFCGCAPVPWEPPPLSTAGLRQPRASHMHRGSLPHVWRRSRGTKCGLQAAQNRQHKEHFKEHEGWTNRILAPCYCTVCLHEFWLQGSCRVSSDLYCVKNKQTQECRSRLDLKSQKLTIVKSKIDHMPMMHDRWSDF